ncbi:MAG TPA: ABC transporter permease [Gemmatimonadaceae bacterium]|nr:ABC transporter permease [Gemmatimonadaceae bacterium]
MTLATAAHELTAAARGLARRPLVPAVLVLVVAVGVAFLVSAFSVFDALLWRAPVIGPHARYEMVGEFGRRGVAQMPYAGVDLYTAYQDALERGRLPAVEALIPLRERTASLVADGVATSETATWLLPASFPHLQTPPLLGRYPADPDGGARLAREIAIGERLWQRRFGGRADVLGQRVALDGESAVIVGVMPAAFQFHRTSEIWAAWSRAEILADPTDAVPLVVRLAPGASHDDVANQLEPVWRAVFAARAPVDSTSRGVAMHGPYGRPIVPPPLARLVFAMMALVLLAACLNIATLYLARMRLRAPDHATRQALGAGRAGVLRLLLTEVLLVVAAGGVLATLAALWLTTWLRDALNRVLPLWVDLRLDARGFAVTLAALTVALVVVALPAMRLVRRLDLARLLTHSGVLGGAPKHGRGASALIATQVAVVVVLAAGAVPIAVSAAKLADVSSGLDDDRVLQVSVHLTGDRYAADSVRDRYAMRVRELLASDPRVEGVARVDGSWHWRAEAAGWSDSIYTDAEPGPLPRSRVAPWRASTDVVSRGYFDVVGLRLVAGRDFDAGLRAGDERVAVLATETARRLFPDGPAVGHRFRWGSTGPWVRVVGVAEDERAIFADWGGTTAERRQVIYLSERQAAPQQMRFYVRARQVTPELRRDVRQAVAGVDPTQPVQDVRLLAEEFAEPRLQRQWLAIVLGSGAVVTVLLAMTGVFGLVSYYTTARLPELALRVALGAPARAVVWLVARGTIRSVAIGAACGALFVGIVQRVLTRFLYETSAVDPVVLAGIALLVTIVVAVAVAVPLRRMRRLAPQELLRVG